MFSEDAIKHLAVDEKDDSPAARMARRWPQKVKVSTLLGLPVNDDGDRTLGRIEQVVRTPDGHVALIVRFNRTFGWFGWFARPVAVPIEVVAMYGHQLASVDMKPEEYAAAPTWAPGRDQSIPPDETIRVALTKR